MVHETVAFARNAAPSNFHGKKRPSQFFPKEEVPDGISTASHIEEIRLAS